MSKRTLRTKNSTEQKSVVISLGDYYPTPSANGICIERIVNQFLQREYSVYLVVNNASNIKDNIFSDNINIIFVKQPFMWRMIELYNKTNRRILKTIIGFIKKIVICLRFPLLLSVYPLDSSRQFKNYYQKIRNIIAQNNVSFVIGVNKPVDAIWGAYLAAKKENVPLISYFLDPLVGGYNNELVNKLIKNDKSLALEDKIIKYSTKIVFMDEHKESVKNRYGDNYESKIKYLGAPLLENQLSSQEYLGYQSEKKVLYAGTIYKSLRNPEYIMRVFNYVKNAKLVMYITNGSSWVNEFINSNVIIKERVPHDVLVEEIKNSYALLNIGNSNPIFAPSKVIEYMGFCKPILSTYCIDNDSSIKYLNKYPSALLIDEREEDIKEAALKIDKFLESQLPIPSFDSLRNMYYDNTPEAFVDFAEKDLN